MEWLAEQEEGRRSPVRFYCVTSLGGRWYWVLWANSQTFFDEGHDVYGAGPLGSGYAPTKEEAQEAARALAGPAWEEGPAMLGSLAPSAPVLQRAGEEAQRHHDGAAAGVRLHLVSVRLGQHLVFNPSPDREEDRKPRLCRAARL